MCVGVAYVVVHLLAPIGYCVVCECVCVNVCGCMRMLYCIYFRLLVIVLCVNVCECVWVYAYVVVHLLAPIGYRVVCECVRSCV